MIRNSFYLFILCTLFLSPFRLHAQVHFETKTYELGDTIGSFAVDTTSSGRHLLRAFTFHSKKDGKGYKKSAEMIFYDLDKNKELWRMPYSYNDWSSMLFNPMGIIKYNGDLITMLNFDDGTPLWSKTGLLRIQDNRNKQILWYKNSFWKNQETIEAHDAKTGEKKWETSMAQGWSSDNSFYLNDSILCVRARGLNGWNIYLVNLHNGKKHQYNTGFNSIKTTMHSNLIQCDSCFYMATKSKLFCLNDTLGEIWYCKLPKDAMSDSKIYADSTRIIMINYGISANYMSMKKNWENQSFGYPFLAGFDRKNGSQLFFKQVAEAKTQMRANYSIDNIEYMMFDNQLAYCELNDTAQIHTVSWDMEKNGKLKGLLGGKLYFGNADNTIFRAVQSDVYRQFVYTDKNMIYEVDKNFGIGGEHHFASCFFPDGQYNGITLIASSSFNEIYVIDSLGTQVGLVKDVLKYTRQVGNRIYTLSTDGTKLVEIKLR